MAAAKVLVIKLGYSETLDPEIGIVPSLGDVLRTTPLLWAIKERYPGAHVSWLVSSQAQPLLAGNHLIDRLLTWDSFVPFQLMKEKFDVVINLEKIGGLCALTDMIDAWVKYGYRFDAVSGVYSAYEKGLDFLAYLKGKQNSDLVPSWQQVLIEMLGVAWKGQPYVLGYKPTTKEMFDIGFNHKVGSKWPTKAMPTEDWKRLEVRLQELGYTVSWQQGHDNLYEYMDWINQCRLLITTDSLGLHLAIAMKKKFIGLFGASDPNEIYYYKDGYVVCSRQDCYRMPCRSAKCYNGLDCMRHIDLAEVENAIMDALGRDDVAREEVRPEKESADDKVS